jgi:hypothetical protein
VPDDVLVLYLQDKSGEFVKLTLDASSCSTSQGTTSAWKNKLASNTNNAIERITL